MAKNFSYPSTRKTTLGARLKMRILPLDIRTPIIYTITTTQNFNSNTNPGIIFLRSNTEVFLSAETKLTFSGITIEIAQDLIINTTETVTPILDLNPNILIPINSISTTTALIVVNGCKSFNITPEIQTIDTSNVSHGIEKEEKQSFNSKKISIEIIEIYGDIGGNQFLGLSENPIYRNYEFWFNYSYPDGSYREGAAIVTSYSPNSNPNNIRSFRIEARIQPKTYKYLNV